jgi:predicted amidohydrolase
MICADAYAPWIAQRLRELGAKILVSSAAWGPGPYGPSGEWERVTSDTGLPLLVCNRTGMDRTLDFTHAESVVVKEGRRLYSMASETSAVFLVDWDLRKQAPTPEGPRTVQLE